MLVVKPIEEESQDEKQGKMLLLTEYSLLSLLHDHPGVIHHHGLFKVTVWMPVAFIEGFFFHNPLWTQDQAYEEQESRNGGVVLTGKKVSRLNLVLDCLSPHDFCPHSHYYVNLQQYVIKEKKLTEQESLLIFRDVVRVVNNLHQVHSGNLTCMLWTAVSHSFLLIF